MDHELERSLENIGNRVKVDKEQGERDIESIFHHLNKKYGAIYVISDIKIDIETGKTKITFSSPNHL